MQIVLAKFHIIDSIDKQSRWKKTDNYFMIIAVIIGIIGLIIADSRFLDNELPKEGQFIFAIGIPILSYLVLLIDIYNNRKPFQLNQEYLVLYPEKLVILNKIKRKILVSDIKSIDFKFGNIDNGPYHPLLYRKSERGNMNFITLELPNEKISFELYLPKQSDKKKIELVINKYTKLILSKKQQNLYTTMHQPQ